ncbi:MAG: hypothetical protein CL685_00925 [Candidatus Magasanikbacteria bacterium]|nr:hypothetical protein [Candidatus Magasanikbacteria bacterium]
MIHARKKKQICSVEKEGDSIDFRIRGVYWGILVVAAIIMVRLFFLMVIYHGFYAQLASGSHELFAQLNPKRGAIYVQDSRNGEELPIAMNRDVFLVYANTKEIQDDNTAEKSAIGLAEIFGYTDEEKLALYYKLNKRDDPYEPIEKDLPEEVKLQIEEKELTGIHFVRSAKRFYPEKTLAAQTVGFLGKDTDGQNIGRYGAEGYWNKELAGTAGFLEGLRGGKGGVVLSAGKVFESAEDGADILLTIDRTIQYKACQILQESMKEYEAESASLLIMDPKSGAIRAMCSLPDFDPNSYGKVETIQTYNNATIFTPYEPGSIFKPITMAAAINEELISPNSVFYDKGFVDDVCETRIRNADHKVYKDQTITGVLEKSINTGMVYVAQQLRKELFRDYVEQFGFGIKAGIALDSEVSGVIDSLYKNKGDAIDCYAATASFGQGITATPLQMASAFSAIANGGLLMKPYVIQEIRHINGKIDRTKSKELRRVLSQRAASLTAGMMVSVVDSGHAAGARVPGYYVAGKTGTAQIAERGGYSDKYNHSFIGFAPVDNPAFVMVVKFENPKRRFSSSTAAPTFGKVARFILDYYGVAPLR